MISISYGQGYQFSWAWNLCTILLGCHAQLWLSSNMNLICVLPRFHLISDKLPWWNLHVSTEGLFRWIAPIPRNVWVVGDLVRWEILEPSSWLSPRHPQDEKHCSLEGRYRNNLLETICVLKILQSALGAEPMNLIIFIDYQDNWNLACLMLGLIILSPHTTGSSAGNYKEDGTTSMVE